MKLDLRVYTTPLLVEGEPYTFFAISDIGDEKRRRALERIFFHDILNSPAGLHGLAEIYRGHEVARGNHLKIDDGSYDLPFTSDKLLPRRVVGNMVKNAAEASGIGDTILLGCQQVGDQVRFWVQNPHHIPRDIQLQILIPL
jgi:signal transduction histidine kinase